MLIPQAIVQENTGSIVRLDSSVLGGVAAFDFTNIPQTYSHLMILLLARTTAASGATAQMFFNGDAGSNYFREKLSSITTTVAGAAGTSEAFGSLGNTTLPGSTDTAGRAGMIQIWIPLYSGSTYHKAWFVTLGASVSTAAGGQQLASGMGTWANTAAITRVQLQPSSGSTFEAGSGAWLYGIT